jgi:hypothetical protein
MRGKSGEASKHFEKGARAEPKSAAANAELCKRSPKSPPNANAAPRAVREEPNCPAVSAKRVGIINSFPCAAQRSKNIIDRKIFGDRGLRKSPGIGI